MKRTEKNNMLDLLRASLTFFNTKLMLPCDGAMENVCVKMNKHLEYLREQKWV